MPDVEVPLSAPVFNYEVHPERPERVRESLLQVWQNLEASGDTRVKFDWSYQQAPHLPETVFVLRTAGQVVGSMGFGVRQFRVAGKDCRVAVLADLSVAPAHRSLAPALSLVKASREYTREHFDFTYGWPNGKAEAVFARARYKTLGRVLRYARVTRYDAYLDRAHTHVERFADSMRIPKRMAEVLTQRPLATLGAHAMSYASRLIDSKSVMLLRRDYQLTQCLLTDPRIDQLWQDARDDYRVIAERTTRFLNWRFANDPVRVFLLTRRRNGSPCAYAVVRHQHGDAQLVDAFGLTHALSPLLTLLFQTLRGDATTHVVSCAYLGNVKFVQALIDNGFERRDDRGRSVFISAADDHSADLDDPGNWHLTACDEDV